MARMMRRSVTSLGRTWLSTMLMRCCLLSVMDAGPVPWLHAVGAHDSPNDGATLDNERVSGQPLAGATAGANRRKASARRCIPRGPGAPSWPCTEAGFCSHCHAETTHDT